MTGIKIVDGVYKNETHLEVRKLTIRVAKTFNGESLSIEDGEKGIALIVPMESIESMIKKGK